MAEKLQVVRKSRLGNPGWFLYVITTRFPICPNIIACHVIY